MIMIVIIIYMFFIKNKSSRNIMIVYIFLNKIGGIFW